MSFEFGALSSINPITATSAFILTIIFLLFFEFLTGALEYLIEGNLIYNQMLQKIYKELMCMDFVSFVLAIYRAENDAVHLDALFRVTEFIEYLLFFQALFYVAHSLYIMFISVVTSSYYEKLHARPVLDILENFTKLEKLWSEHLLSTISYLPISRTIQEAEFKIIYALFRDTYWLPLDFDYGAYLSGCLANYALKLINVGVYSWIIMISLSLINLGRLKIFGNNAFNCQGYQYTDDVQHHTDDHHTDDHIVTDDHSSTDDHHTDDSVTHRSLSSSSTEPVREVTHHCELQHLYLFLICGGLLCVYSTLLYIVAQIYMKR